MNTMVLWVLACVTFVTSGTVGAAEPAFHFDRRTPVVTAYAKTHGAVVNISGQRPVTRRGCPQSDGPRTSDLRGPRFQQLNSVIEFYVRMMIKEVGEPIALKVVRTNENKPTIRAVELTLRPRPLPDGRLLAKRLFQMDVSPLTAPVARHFDFESAYPILIVTAVDPNGTAGRAGIHSGDLLLQANGVTVRDENEFAREIEKVSDSDTVEFKILRITMGLFGQIDRHLRIPVQACVKAPH